MEQRSPSLAIAVDALGARLRETGRMLATAESITGGELASALVSTDDSVDWYMGGVVANATSVKRALLGIGPDAVDGSRAAVALASGAISTMNADVTIATCGASGAGSPSDDSPGTVWIAVAIDDDVEVREFHFTGTRSEVCVGAVSAAIAYASSRLRVASVPVRPDAVGQRANLTAEELVAGSDDPQRQAAAILEESTERVLSGGDRSAAIERRTSADTVAPPDLV